MDWPLSFQQTTVACAVVGAVIAIFQQWRTLDKLRLEAVVSKLLAGSTVPTGLFLLACAFNPALVSRLSEVGLYLAAAAIALLYVSIAELAKP